MSNYWVCSSLVDGVCQQWVERSFLVLAEGEGLKIGGMLLLATATAWGTQQVARLLLNR